MREMISIDSIIIGNDFNPRKGELKNINELAASIKQSGLIQPLVVKKFGDESNGHSKYFLVAGHRRLAACKQLGHTTLEAKIVDESVSDEELAIIALVENAQRVDLDPYMEAEAMQTCMAKFGWSQRLLAEKLGVSEPHVSQRMGILKRTITEVKNAVETGRITATHAREIAGLPAEEQLDIITNIEVKQKAGKRVTVADIKNETDRRKQRIKTALDPDALKKRKAAIKAAKNFYNGKSFSIRPSKDIVAQLGVLQTQLARVQTDTRQAVLK